MTYVALLRGINVGAGRSVGMVDLRRLCEELGWSKVRTYIQSGNVVFQSDVEPGPLARALESALAHRYAFPIPVMIRSADQWQELASDRPFDGWSHPKFLSVSLLDTVPATQAWQSLAPWRDADDQLELIGDRVWVKTPNGYGETRFHNTFLEKKLGVRATTRNRTSVETLLAMF